MLPNKVSQLQHSQAPHLKQVSRKRYIRGQGYRLAHDQVSIEEPLQISLEWQVNGQTHCEVWTMTMRTPGDDIKLVYGLLLSQHVIEKLEDIESIESFDEHSSYAFNHILVTLSEGVEPQLAASARRFISTSSCGICGSASIRAIECNTPSQLEPAQHWLCPELVLQLPMQLKQHQVQFEQTGCVHGVGYFVDGELIAFAEDIGRHNALDKLLGELALKQAWHPQGVLVLSSRVSFELMQKALAFGAAVIVSLGAPSSLAVDIARQFDITLIGFTKNCQFNLYNGHWRLKPEPTRLRKPHES